MIGKTLALVRRALIFDVRDLRSHLFRAALAAVILFTLFSSQMTQFLVTSPGLQLFSSIANLNFFFITIAGATYFASAITEEKEERTLPLLKMAGIGPLALLIGKWLPRMLAAMLLLAIQIPFTILATTLGGILWHQILAAYVALLAHLVFVGNLGLLMSVICRNTTRACSATLIIILLMHLLPWPIKSLAEGLFSSGAISFDAAAPIIWICEKLIEMSAIVRLNIALSTGFNEPLVGFQVVSNVVAGLICFGLSWRLFERCTRNDVEPTPAVPWPQRVGNLFHRKGPRSPRRAWEWAIVWKDYYFFAGGPVAGITKFLIYGVLIAGVLFLANDFSFQFRRRGELAGFILSVSLPALIIELLVQVTRLYRAELTDKTWSSLCMLPLSLPHIAYAKLAGCLLGLLPAGLWVVLGLGVIFDDFLEGLGEIFTHIEALSGVTYFLTQCVLGIQLAVYLSIAARWAVWPLALFVSYMVMWMGNMVLIPCLAFGRGGDVEVAFIVLSFFSILGCIVLHRLIGKKLEALAAES